MRFLALFLCVGLVAVERPTVNLPLACRQANWSGHEGSCVFATTVSLLKWQGRYNTANWVRRNCSNGAGRARAAAIFDRAGIRYAYTRGDVKFLEWAIRTRRGAGVVIMGGDHMVALVHLDASWACIMDPNTRKFHGISRGSFLAEWRASGGWALAVVYTPAAPMP